MLITSEAGEVSSCAVATHAPCDMLLMQRACAPCAQGGLKFDGVTGHQANFWRSGYRMLAQVSQAISAGTTAAAAAMAHAAVA